MSFLEETGSVEPGAGWDLASDSDFHDPPEWSLSHRDESEIERRSRDRDS